MSTSSPSSGQKPGLWLLLPAVFLGGLGAGWLIDRPAGGDAGRFSGSTANTVANPRATDRGSGEAAAARMLAPASSPQFADSVRNVLRDPDGRRRLLALNRLLEHATPAHMMTLVDLIKQDEALGNDAKAEWSALWKRWGEIDGKGAVRYLEAQGPQLPWMPEALDEAMISWVETDASAAIRFFENGEGGQQDDRVLAPSLVRGLCARGDLDAAIAVLGEAEAYGPNEFDPILVAVRRQSGAAGEDALFERLAADSSKTKEAASVAQALLSSRQFQDPVNAAQWVDAHLGDGWQPGASDLQSLAENYAAKDAPAALAWADSLPAPSRARAVGSAWRHLLQTDRPRAMSWLEKNAADPDFRAAAVTNLAVFARMQPDQAKDVAAGIQDEGLKAEALQAIDKAPQLLRR